MLVDLRPKNATGKRAEQALGRAYITCNKNGIPFDPEKPFVTSGIRLGTPAGTTRGFGEAEFRLDRRAASSRCSTASAKPIPTRAMPRSRPRVRDKVQALTARFPIYED